MEYFSIIYSILKAIELSMDYEEFDENSLSPEFLHVSRPRWEAIMTELVRSGYISGVDLVPIAGRAASGIRITKPVLTIRGAEYLSENAMMKKSLPPGKRYQGYNAGHVMKPNSLHWKTRKTEENHFLGGKRL